MRIAFLQPWFSEVMGYIDNCLPKAVAALGHDVHLVTSNVKPYFNTPTYGETYEKFLGPGVVDPCVTELDGYTVHRLRHMLVGRRLRIRGVLQCLAALKPDIVQAFECVGLPTYEACFGKYVLDYKLFLESHIHASVFPDSQGELKGGKRAKWWLYSRTLGAFVSRTCSFCHPISADAEDIAVRLFGMRANKVSQASLGVDTDAFRPPSGHGEMAAREQLRKHLGFEADETVCVYTGRLLPDKGPGVLTEAVASLVAQGYKVRGLFIGDGTPEVRQHIAASPGCVVHPFVPYLELPRFYQAADIGVWPMQESTSQLDAAASGLPVVLSDQIRVTERADGNGLLYRQGDPISLASRLLELQDPQVRRALGARGVEKMRAEYSWTRLARERITAYESALNRLNSPTWAGQ